MVHTDHKKFCTGFTTASHVVSSAFLLFFLGGSLAMHWNSDIRAVSAECFLASEPHTNYSGHLNKSEVVLVHFKCFHMCSTHFMPIKIVGVFCSWRSPCWRCYKGIKIIKAVYSKASCKTCQIGAVRARTSAPVGSQFRPPSSPGSEEYKDGLKLVLLMLRSGCEFSPPASRHAV